MAGIVIAIIAILGITGAAQSSLPGSVLYGVKVNVNEELRAGLTLTAAGKADFEAQRATERVKEAEELSEEASVSADVTAQIEANFKEFANRAQERVDALISTDARAAADIASNFQTALTVHEKVLARLQAQSNESNRELSGLQKDVDQELSDTVKERMKAEAEVKTEDHTVDVKTAAEGKLTAAANVINEVTNFINDKSSQLGADAVVKAQAQLDIAKSLMVQAQAKLNAGSYPDAFNLGNQVIRTAQGAKLLIEVQEDLDVDLHLGGRPSTTPSISPRPTPETEGLMESERTGVHIEFGF